MAPGFGATDRMRKKKSEQRYADDNRRAFHHARVLAIAQCASEDYRIAPTIL